MRKVSNGETLFALGGCLGGQQMKITGASAWEWDGASGVDAGAWIASAQHGNIKLINKAGSAGVSRILLSYSTGGFGFGSGWDAGISVSTASMPDVGKIYKTDNLKGADFKPGDFDGLVVVHSSSVGATSIGGSHTMIFFGISPAGVPVSLLKSIGQNAIDVLHLDPGLLLGPGYPIYKLGKFLFGDGDPPIEVSRLAGDAKGVIRTTGMSTGFAVGVGVSFTFGYMSSSNLDYVAKLDAVPRPDAAPSREDTGIKFSWVTRTEGLIKLPAGVLFGFGDHRIGSGRGGLAPAETVLRAIAYALRTMAPRVIMVEGHTDSIDSDASNLKLSKRRAEAVKNWLGTRGGVTTRTVPVGYGEKRPVADNRRNGVDYPAGRELNRRVEIRFLM